MPKHCQLAIYFLLFSALASYQTAVWFICKSCPGSELYSHDPELACGFLRPDTRVPDPMLMTSGTGHGSSGDGPGGNRSGAVPRRSQGPMPWNASTLEASLPWMEGGALCGAQQAPM